MRKKLLASILTVCMLFTMLPTAAFAEEGNAYTALAAAIDEAPTDGTETTVTLTGDITDMTTDQIITVQEGQNIVLDMAGHSITVADGFAGRPIVNEGTLTVTGNGTIDASASEDGFGAINNKNTLTIENGTYRGAAYASGSGIRNTGESAVLVIEDGVFEEATCAVYNEGTATIKNGRFSNHSCSACAKADGHEGIWSYVIRNATVDSKMTIDGGTFTGTQGAASAAVGSLTVNGGYFKTVDCDRNHGAIFYALYAAGEVGEVETVINGGTFETEGKISAVLIGNDNKNGDGGINAQAAAEIRGGTFKAPQGVPAVKRATETGQLSITGGTFSSDVSAYMDLSSNVTEDTNGNFVIIPNKEEDCVAEIDGKYYKSLGDAIASAGDGDTVRLLEDISGDFTVDKPVIIDGQNQFAIIGATKLQNGMLKNLTLTTNSNSLLTIGSSEQNTIRMEGVTVKYPVSGTAGGTVNVLSGNNADITITGCIFMNEANNGGVTEKAPQWSYGLYMNDQGAAGSFTMTNSRFDGAFRTMLSSINGNVTIQDNEFVNSVYSVANGPTSGAQAEATCITTADADVSGISITNNVFDNAGAFYFQKSQGATVTGNVFKFDKFEHYIQLRGGAAHPLDLTKNTFEMGENDLVIVDVAAAPVLFPAGQKAVSYWAWKDTPEGSRPVDYSTYIYAYNADGSRTFYPESDAALNAFLKPATGNIGIVSGDTVEIHQDLSLTDAVEIPADAVLVIDSSATLTVPEGVTLTNHGTIVNPDRINGAVTPGDTAAVKQTVRFEVDPVNAQVVVKDQSGAVIAPESANLYYLADGAYTYTVFAQNYYEQSKTFVVSGQAQTIDVVLTKISSGGGSYEPSGDYLVSVDKTTGGKVTVNPGRADKGDTVTITVKPDKGYELDELTVTAKNGDTVKLTEKSNGKFTFKMPGSKVTVEAVFVKENGEQPVVTLPFADVNKGDWFYDAVEYVYGNDLMNGTSATAFSPYLTTSRAMMLTMLARYDGVDTTTGSTWYEAGAVWAVAEGISDGTNLEADLTREQLVTMLWRYTGSPVVESDLSAYPDGGAVSDWAVNAMIWATQTGVIIGNGAGALAPQGTATRAEVATILARFCAMER